MHRSRAVLCILGIAIVLIVVFTFWRPSHQEMASALSPQQLALLDGQEIVVYKSPLCSCCSEYEEYLRQHGMAVVSVVEADLTPYKAQGLAPEYWSCHTAMLGDYFVEGHVPVEVIVKLLEESPDVAGVSLPGMPSGSPGMPGEKTERWTIYALGNGKVSPFVYY